MTEIEMYGEPIEGKVVYVGGNRAGKSQAQREMVLQMGLYWIDEPFNPEAPRVADLENATDLTPYLMRKMYASLQVPLYRHDSLGPWEYTPAEELRDRLNMWLQGKDPGLPTNTRYWRGQ